MNAYATIVCCTELQPKQIAASASVQKLLVTELSVECAEDRLSSSVNLPLEGMKTGAPFHNTSELVKSSIGRMKSLLSLHCTVRRADKLTVVILYQ